MDHFETPVEQVSYRKYFFAFSAILAVLTAWAVYDETVVRRPWKGYQRQFKTIEYQKVKKDYDKFMAESYNGKRVDELQQKMKEEELRLDQSKEYQEASAPLKKADIAYSDAVLKRREVKAMYDEAAYEYTHAKHHGGSHADKRHHVMEELKTRLAGVVKQAAEMEADRNAKKAVVDGILASMIQMKSEWEKLVSVKQDLEDKLDKIKSRPIKIHQVMVPDLHKIDRCQSCHVGIEKRGFDSPDLPKVFRSHPGLNLPLTDPKNILARHPVEKYGCTVCHRGDGEATKFKNAHGYQRYEKDNAFAKSELVHYHMEPMIKKEFSQAACAKCHTNTTLPGMEVVQLGKQLVKKYGCQACHKGEAFPGVVGWEGGAVSVDLSNIADKTQDEIDYTFVEKPHTWDNYIVQRLLNSQKVNPARPEHGVPYDSPMPNYHMSREEAVAIATYLHAFTRETKAIPASYKVATPAPPMEEKGSAGRQVFVKYGCGACHGLNGEGGRINYNYEGGPTKEKAQIPKLRNLSEKYTDSELEERINLGTQPVGKFDPNDVTPPLFMPKWKGIISKAEMGHLVEYLKTLKEAGAKDKSEDW